MLKTISGKRAYSRARRWAGLATLLFFVAVLLLYSVLTDPELIRGRCERYLREFVEADVSVERAGFGLFEGIHLIGVHISERTTDAEGHAQKSVFFSCRNLLLKHDPAAMLIGRLRVKEIVAVNPVCHLVRSDETGDYNLGRVLREGTRRRSGGRLRLPVVRLRDASLIIARQNGGERREVDRLHLSLLATPVPGAQGAFEIAWKRAGVQPAGGRSRFELDELSFTDLEGGLPWMALETGMLAVATQVPQAERWFSLLGLEGQIKAEGYEITGHADRPEPPRLTLDSRSHGLTVRLRNTSLSIPGDEDELALPRDQRYLCFEEVQGVARLSAGQADFQFTGRFHGAPCRVAATLTGEVGPDTHLDDVGLAAQLWCQDFTLPSTGEDAPPAAVRFVKRWRPVRSFYNDFDPHARVNLEIELTKEPGGPVRLQRGVMTVLEGDGSYRKFPYRVNNLTGVVEVTSQGIYLRDVSGDHDGAPIVVNGWLAESRWYAATEMQVAGTGVRLDPALRSALNDQDRKLWDTFALSGTADIQVVMTRAPGTAEEPRPFLTTVDAELSGAEARFEGFPYPIAELSGHVRIEGDRLSVSRLSGCNGAAQVSVDGFAETVPDGLADLKLRLEAEGVAFNDELLAALPADVREQVGCFNPQGRFDLSGELTFDPARKRTVYDLNVFLRDARMAYAALPVPVERVTGTIHLAPGEVTLGRLAARYGDSPMSVDGAFSRDADRVDAHAVVTCERLVADEALLSALPDKVSRICRDLRIGGPVNVVTRYEKKGAAGAAAGAYAITIHPAGASVNPVQFPYPLTITAGEVTVQPEQAVIRGLRVKHGDTEVTLDGAVTFKEGSVEGRFALSGRNIPLDEDLRLAVPWRWRRTWNQTAPSGGVDLALDRLDYRRAPGASSGEWSFDWRLRLNDVGMDAGVAVAGATGTLEGTGHVGPAPAGLNAGAAINLDTVTVSRRRVERVRGRLAYSSADGLLALHDLTGEVCGGLVASEVEVGADSGSSRYQVTATLQDVDLREFLRAETAGPAYVDSLAGRLEAHLFLEGALGDPGSRRGGGRLHIGQADLYQLPLMLSILHVINLTAPEESAFQEMKAQFLVDGPRVQVEDLLLQGSALALIGSGSILPATRTVDLNLVAVTPHRWAQVPVVTELLEGASRELVEIEVHGPLGEPVIEAKPLPGVEAAFETLFQKKQPRKRALVKPSRRD